MSLESNEVSPEERAAIAERVSLVGDGVLLWREVPVPSLVAVEIMAEKVQELTQGLDAYTRVVDLSESARPNAKVRRRLRDMLAGEDRLRHIGVFTQKNILINVALKFVFSGISDQIPLSVHRDYDDALEACTHALHGEA